ncbi:MAG: hypothetical protein ACYTFA_01105 [Planctomycetota bacterium]|jgi:hypothetical protein
MSTLTHRRKWTIAAVTLLLPAGLVVALDDFEISRWTIDGGGELFTTGGDYELSGTVGQPDAGAITGGAFELTGGLWFPLATGDCNSDGGVNAFDYSDFGPCLSGPGAGLLMLDCDCFDIDNDEDVDLSDVAQFQRSFTGG